MTRMPINFASRNRARILIVDGDQTTTRAFGVILQHHGYKVATALSGKEALARAAFFAPDLLVSELGVGGKSEIKDAVQITEMLPECKLLFLSAHMSMSDLSEAVPGHLVYSFTSMPLRPVDLLNAICNILPAPNIST